MADDGAAVRHLGDDPRPLAEALRLVLALTPTNQGQETAQRGLVTALDARGQRIIVSQSEVN